MKRCTKCGKRRRISQFDADASRADGTYAQCKGCKHTPKRRKQINAVRADAHKASVKSANRIGRPWTATEDKAVMELSFKDAAAKTGRTYWSVAQRRYRLRHPDKKTK
jgi:hypothetical protein